MHKLIDYIDREMREYESEVARGGELSAKDLECLKDLAKTKMAILTNEAMEEDNRYSYNYDSMNGMSRARGRGRNARRDAMGRYSSDYSYDDAKADMESELHELMRKAPDETTKRKFQKFIDEMREV